MPALPKQRICATAEDGTYFDKLVSAAVTTTGLFTLGIPDELQDIAATLLHSNSDLDSRKWREVGIAYKQHHQGDRIETKKLEDGIKFLRACAEKHLDVEQITERVIAYRCAVDANFWIDERGDVHANGYKGNDTGTGSRKGQWFESKSKRKRFMTNEIPPAFSIGLAAAVFDRTTFKRSTGDTVLWKEVNEDNEDAEITALHAFRLSLDPEQSSSFRGEGELRTMPYTPQAAAFFVEVLRGICKIAKSLDDFFGDEKRLMLAIERGGSLALPFK